jgi:hypothetical protein
LLNLVFLAELGPAHPRTDMRVTWVPVAQGKDFTSNEAVADRWILIDQICTHEGHCEPPFPDIMGTFRQDSCAETEE